MSFEPLQISSTVNHLEKKDSDKHQTGTTKKEQKTERRLLKSKKRTTYLVNARLHKQNGKKGRHQDLQNKLPFNPRINLHTSRANTLPLE
jgi:hypothetical protein